MDLISFIFIIFLFTVLVWYITTPLFIEHDKFLRTTDKADSKRKKENLLQQIKELELDYNIGNVNKTDYLTIRKTLKNQISSIILKMEDI